MDPADGRNLLLVLLATLTTLLSCVSTRRNHSMPAAAHTPAEHLPKPSIARIWRGRVSRERADEFNARIPRSFPSVIEFEPLPVGPRESVRPIDTWTVV